MERPFDELQEWQRFLSSRPSRKESLDPSETLRESSPRRPSRSITPPSRRHRSQRSRTRTPPTRDARRRIRDREGRHDRSPPDPCDLWFDLRFRLPYHRFISLANDLVQSPFDMRVSVIDRLMCAVHELNMDSPVVPTGDLQFHRCRAESLVNNISATADIFLSPGSRLLFVKEFATFVDKCKIRTVAMDHVLNLSTRTGFLERYCPPRARDESPPRPLGHSVFNRLGNPDDDQANPEQGETVAIARDEMGTYKVVGYPQGDVDAMTNPRNSPNIEIKTLRVSSLGTSSDRESPKRQGMTSVVAESAPAQSSRSRERDELKKRGDRKPRSRDRLDDKAKNGEKNSHDRTTSDSTGSSAASPSSSPSSSDSCTVTSSTLPEDASKKTSQDHTKRKPSDEKRKDDGRRMSDEHRRREVKDRERRRSEEDRRREMRDRERRRHMRRSSPSRRSPPPPPRRPSHRTRHSPPPPPRERRRISTDKQERVFGISSGLRNEMLHAKEILKAKKESGKSDSCHKVQDCTVSGTDDGLKDERQSVSEQHSCQGHKSPTTDVSRTTEKQSGDTNIGNRDELHEKTQSATTPESGNRISCNKSGSLDCASENSSKPEQTSLLSKSTSSSKEVRTTAPETGSKETAKGPVCVDISTEQIETASGSYLSDTRSTKVNGTVAVTNPAPGTESRSYPAVTAVKRGNSFVARTRRSLSLEPVSDAEEQRNSVARAARTLSLEPVSDIEEHVHSPGGPGRALSLEPISDAELQLNSAAELHRALSLEPISDAEEQFNSVVESPRGLSLEPASDAETSDPKTSGNANRATSDDEAALLESSDCVDPAEAHYVGTAARTRGYERVKDVPLRDELQEASSSATEQVLVSAPDWAENRTTILRSGSSEKEKESVSCPSPTPSKDLSLSLREDTVKESSVEMDKRKVNNLSCTGTEHTSGNDGTGIQMASQTVVPDSNTKDVSQAIEKESTPTSHVESSPVCSDKASDDTPLTEPAVVSNELAVDSGTSRASNVDSSSPSLPKSNISTEGSVEFSSRPGSSESEQVDLPRNETMSSSTVTESTHLAPLSVSTGAQYPSSSLLGDSLFDAFRGNYITQAAPEMHSVYGRYGSEMANFRYGGYPVSPQPGSPAPEAMRSPVPQTARRTSTQPDSPSSPKNSCVEAVSHQPSGSPSPQQVRSPMPQAVSPPPSTQPDMPLPPTNSCVEPETSDTNMQHPVASETRIGDNESFTCRSGLPEPTAECPTASIAKESSRKKHSRNIFERLGDFTSSESPTTQMNVKMEAPEGSTAPVVNPGQSERLSAQALVDTSITSHSNETLSVCQAEPEPTHKLPRSTHIAGVGISSERRLSTGFPVSGDTSAESFHSLGQSEGQSSQNVDFDVYGDEKVFKEKVMNSNVCDQCFEHISRQSAATYLSLIFGHDMKSRYYCFDCTFNTFDVTSFSNHLHSEHSRQSVLQCMFCAKAFSSIQELLTHQTWKHVPRKMCKHCGFCTTSRAVLMKHQATAHPNAPKRILGQNVKMPACVDHTCLVLHRCWRSKIGKLLSVKPTEPPGKRPTKRNDSVDSRTLVENLASVVNSLPLALKRRRSSEDPHTPLKRTKGLSKRCSGCDELMASPRAAKSHTCRSSSQSSAPGDHPLLPQPSHERSTTVPNESHSNNHLIGVTRSLLKKQFSEPIIPVSTVSNRKRRCVRCKELMKSPKIAKKHVCATLTKTESVSLVRESSENVTSHSSSETSSGVDTSRRDTSVSITPVKSEVHEDSPLSSSVEVINLISDDEEELTPELEQRNETPGNAESNLEGCILVTSSEDLMRRLAEKLAHSRKVVATPEALDLPPGEVFQHATECPGCVVIFWSRKHLLQHLRTAHNVHCCGSI